MEKYRSAAGGISPSTIKIPARPEKSGESGENGNLTPLSPLSPAPSSGQNFPEDNAAFLAALFASAGDDETVAVCSKLGDPTSGPWMALDAKTVGQTCPPSSNNYFNCSSLRRTSEGELKATAAQVAGFHVLVLDDVGTKVSLEAVAGLEPTYAVETSPGNFQYGYVLETPLENLDEIAALQNAVAAAGLCDNGAKGAPRWVRLPYAINGKEKYRGDDGQPYRCQPSHRRRSTCKRPPSGSGRNVRIGRITDSRIAKDEEH